ncbi:MAG: Wzz/FepE/Etk N-terminal domain-containing protein [candidate division NC10 bacterium]|nr:Wzz/FepE/Etk N-terminal domain-containing protein [candidate division NC10 bacterium]
MMADVQRDWRDEGSNLLDYWWVLRKRGWMIVGLCVVAVLYSGINDYFFATRIFESRASILPPKESGGGALSSALSGAGAAQFPGGLLTSSGSSKDTFVAILKSRTMAEELVNRFNLTDHYKATSASQAINAVRGSMDVTTSKEGVITVKVADPDPKFAADLANAFIANLDRMYAKFGTTEGSRQKAFIGDRLDKTEKALRQAEDALRRFQETHKAIGVQEQARDGITETSRLRGQVIAAEVALEALRGYGTENNPLVLQQKARVEELKRQLAQMQYSAGRDLPSETKQPGQNRQDFSIPAVKVPEIAMESGRLFREVKIQETVFALLTQQYEQAKITEARDTPLVQLLDRAVPAEQRSRPQIKLNMVIAGGISLLVGVFLAFFLEYLERLRRLGRSATS